jgi:AmmeMemoRadiSam system protein B
MLVGGVILPHPPIILPGYAHRRGTEVDQTIGAVQEACRWIAETLRPERIVIASPHRGHGFDVPLHFLGEALDTSVSVEELLTADPSYDAYRDLGEALRQREARRDERVVVVASGDCSHRLSEDGPYGFHPQGPELDRALVAGIAAGDVRALLDIDRRVVEAGGECGLRAFIFALAALGPARCEILAYQAPYGVGYLVASVVPAPHA